MYWICVCMIYFIQCEIYLRIVLKYLDVLDMCICNIFHTMYRVHDMKIIPTMGHIPRIQNIQNLMTVHIYNVALKIEFRLSMQNSKSTELAINSQALCLRGSRSRAVMSIQNHYWYSMKIDASFRPGSRNIIHIDNASEAHLQVKSYKNSFADWFSLSQRILLICLSVMLPRSVPNFRRIHRHTAELCANILEGCYGEWDFRIFQLKADLGRIVYKLLRVPPHRRHQTRLVKNINNVFLKYKNLNPSSTITPHLLRIDPYIYGCWLPF